MAEKVFVIGFHKTGTSSLGKALIILGYRVKGPFGTRDPNISKNVYETAFRLAEQYDAFEDMPWPIIYKELDKKYPGSKFILLLRPEEKWIKSVVFHLGKNRRPAFEWIYGFDCPTGNEAAYLARYRRHNQEVLEYFKDRPDDFLVLRLEEGDGWKKLCDFLHKDIPNMDFPHVNKSVDRAKKRKRRTIRRFFKRTSIVLLGLLLAGIILYWVRSCFVK